MRIYLSGGMRGDWQDRVMAACPGHDYLDPRSHKLTDPAAYTAWDLDAVRRSDLVFAYMAADNPSGYGLALEVGYAIGLGIPVLLVDEAKRPEMAIVREAATWLLPSLADGVAELRRMATTEHLSLYLT